MKKPVWHNVLINELVFIVIRVFLLSVSMLPRAMTMTIHQNNNNNNNNNIFFLNKASHHKYIFYWNYYSRTYGAL